MHELRDLSDLFGVKLSAGSVQASIAQAAQTLAPEVKRIAAAVSASPVVHFDETGQRDREISRAVHRHRARTAPVGDDHEPIAALMKARALRTPSTYSRMCSVLESAIR